MGCGRQFTDTRPSLVLPQMPGYGWYRMWLLENRASVSLVCKQWLLRSSNQTEGTGTLAGTVIYVTEGRSGCLYFSPPSPEFTHSPPFSLFCLFVSSLCFASPALLIQRVPAGEGGPTLSYTTRCSSQDSRAWWLTPPGRNQAI